MTLKNRDYLCSFYNNTGQLQDEYYIYFSDSNGHIHKTCAGFNLNGEDNRILVDFNKEGFLSESSSWTFFSVLHSQSEMTNTPSPSFTISAPADRALDVPDGLKITSGDGTQSNPFQLELVYSSEPKPAYENVTVGKKWLIGDTINTDAYFKVDVPILGDYDDIYTQEKTLQFLRKPLSTCVKSNYGPYGAYTTKSYIEFNGITTGAFDYHYMAEQYEFYSNILLEGDVDLVTGIEVTGGSGTKADPFTLAPITANQPKLVSNSMTLGGSISLNFYYDLSEIPADKKADTYVEFEVNGKKQTANFDANKMNKAKTAYGFNCKLNSISMADDVKTTIHYFDANGVEKTCTKTATCEQYLRKFNEQLDGGTKSWELIKGINDYGYYMQKYLSSLKTTNWVLGVDHRAMELAFRDHGYFNSNKAEYIKEIKGQAKSFGTNKNIEKVNYSLVLDSNTAINFKIKKKEGYTGKFIVTVDGKSVTPKKLTDGRFQVTVAGIPAHKLNEVHTVKVTTDSGTTTYKASAISYLYECISKPNSDLEFDAMCAMYEYYKATVAYKNS